MMRRSLCLHVLVACAPVNLCYPQPGEGGRLLRILEGMDNATDLSCPSHCGGHGLCTNGKCKCDTGYAPPDCVENACPNRCSGHGSCEAGICRCATGWRGTADCSQDTCPDHCSGHGRCMLGKCECFEGFKPPACRANQCPGTPPCNGHGKCVNSVCSCFRGWTDYECATETCPAGPQGVCSGHGKCVTGKCDCLHGWEGISCCTPICPNNCNGKGVCKYSLDKAQTYCECYPGFRDYPVIGNMSYQFKEVGWGWQTRHLNISYADELLAKLPKGKNITGEEWLGYFGPCAIEVSPANESLPTSEPSPLPEPSPLASQ